MLGAFTRQPRVKAEVALWDEKRHQKPSQERCRDYASRMKAAIATALLAFAFFGCGGEQTTSVPGFSSEKMTRCPAVPHQPRARVFGMTCDEIPSTLARGVMFGESRAAGGGLIPPGHPTQAQMRRQVATRIAHTGRWTCWGVQSRRGLQTVCWEGDHEVEFG